MSWRRAWDEHGVMHVVRSSHQPHAISRGIHHSSSASRRTPKPVANSPVQFRMWSGLPVAIKSLPPRRKHGGVSWTLIADRDVSVTEQGSHNITLKDAF